LSDEFIIIGKVVSTQGNKGEVKVLPLTDSTDRFKSLASIFIRNNNIRKTLNIEKIRSKENIVILKLEDIDNIEKAKMIVGSFLEVERKNAVKLPKDTYFIFEIIGLGVYTENNIFLGKVENVISTGSNDVYIVKNRNKEELYIPATREVVKNINLEKKRITINIVINILTIFPNMFKGPFSESILKRAQEKGLIKINLIDLRDFTLDKHKTVDDYSYGGGPGMVLKPQPIWDAVEVIKKSKSLLPLKIIITSAQGKIFNQGMAKDLSKEKRLLIICGRYEGIDERIPQLLDAEEVSIGNFVVSGGELPAMLMVDVISRMIPGVLGKEESMVNDSFYNGYLDYPHYTRPDEFKGSKVPDVLLSGNHKEIEKWREKQSLLRTLIRRPETFTNKKLTKRDINLFKELENSLKEN
jgi:tRNA (guanine37-N1)-methyltransferase